MTIYFIDFNALHNRSASMGVINVQISDKKHSYLTNETIVEKEQESENNSHQCFRLGQSLMATHSMERDPSSYITKKNLLQPIVLNSQLNRFLEKAGFQKNWFTKIPWY